MHMDTDINNANDKDTCQTKHDCMGSLPNEPKIWITNLAERLPKLPAWGLHSENPGSAIANDYSEHKKWGVVAFMRKI